MQLFLFLLGWTQMVDQVCGLLVRHYDHYQCRRNLKGAACGNEGDEVGDEVKILLLY